MDFRFAATRRAILGLAAAAIAALATPALAGRDDPPPPIVFVHGNGDSAAEWMVTLWRFESNGYPRDRLFAPNLRYPTARTLDDQPEPGTSSADEAARRLADFVDDVLDATGARKVALVGNSRGANTIRNFVKNKGGAAVTSHVALGGGVNHGVFAIDFIRPTSEFNGTGPFMRQLNRGDDEVVDGVKFLTLRSDFFDKYAQPDGRFVFGFSLPTGVSYDAPALKGAKNIVLPGVDHRESAMGEDAFPEIFAFITGKEPDRIRIDGERRPVLDGAVTGITAGLYDNIPVEGAELTIFEVNARNGERRGAPVHSVVTGKDGAWGPFEADGDAAYEFVLEVPGQPVTHIYRSPFPRGSDIVHLRPAEVVPDPNAGSVVILSRPSGYFGIHDRLLFDGVRPAISTDPVPNVAEATLRVPFTQGAHTARFLDERIAVQNWPKGHVTIVEFND